MSSSRRRRPPGPVPLAAELASAFRPVMIALAAVMLITLVRLSVVAQLEARQDRYLEAKAALATSHQAMLDQQTGLRGWQLSGDRRFLAPYSSGSKSLEEADAALFADTAQDPRLAALVLSNSRDQQARIDLWVPRALDAGPESRASSSLNLEGKRLFDAYRESAATLHSGIDEQLALLHQRDQQVFWFGAITQMLIAAFALLSSRRQLGRLHENVALPLQELLVTVRRVRDGDLSAVASARGPAELQDLAAQLAETTEALAGARDRGDQREAELATQAESSERALELARDFNATLDLAAVSESVVTGALRLSGFSSARVWLADADRQVLRLSRASGEVAEPSSELLRLGDALAGRSAQHGQTMFATDEGVGLRRPGAMLGLALPMIAGGRSIGVLELSSPEPVAVDNASLHLLETVTTHAGLALEAARLHRQPRSSAAVTPSPVCSTGANWTPTLPRRPAAAAATTAPGRSCSATSTTSSRSTTGTATCSATRCCATWRPRCATACATPTLPTATGARSSPCCCARPMLPLLPPWSNGCGRPSSSASRGGSPRA